MKFLGQNALEAIKTFIKSPIKFSQTIVEKPCFKNYRIVKKIEPHSYDKYSTGDDYLSGDYGDENMKVFIPVHWRLFVYENGVQVRDECVMTTIAQVGTSNLYFEVQNHTDKQLTVELDVWGIVVEVSGQGDFPYASRPPLPT